RLVRNDEVVMARKHADLPPENLLGLASFPLGLELADAGDYAQPCLERMLGAHRRGLVGLAEVLPPLGVADDRARDAELEQDPRRDLAREGSFIGPVHVLGVDRVAARNRRAERTEGRTEHRVDAALRCEGGAEIPRL